MRESVLFRRAASYRAQPDRTGSKCTTEPVVCHWAVSLHLGGDLTFKVEITALRYWRRRLKWPGISHHALRFSAQALIFRLWAPLISAGALGKFAKSTVEIPQTPPWKSDKFHKESQKYPYKCAPGHINLFGPVINYVLC